MPKATVAPSLPPSPVPRHSAPRSGGTATAPPPIARPDAPTDTDQPSLCTSRSVGPNSQPEAHSAAALPTATPTSPTANTVAAAASDNVLVAKSALDIGVEVRGADPFGHVFPVKSALRNLGPWAPRNRQRRRLPCAASSAARIPHRRSTSTGGRRRPPRVDSSSISGQSAGTFAAVHHSAAR